MAQTESGSPNNSQISVSDLANALKRTLEDRFSYVRVRGEISGYRGPHTSGHVYFALKDEGARIDAIIWRTTFARMKIKPEEGLEVIASGKITTFPAKSAYQIVVESLEPAGAGALMALLDARRRQLAAEGLFAAERKRPLPFLPRTIGVVTSPTGAVIRDILHRLSDRFPVRVLLWPVRVQGEGAAEEIAAAIRGMNALESGLPVPDVLIVARGGGSLEDLWSFNDEAVVRATADSRIPVVSAVGHETDWTLIDHAADVRAPTPTAAAELCVPVRADLIARVAQLEARGLGAVTRVAKQNQASLRSAARAMPSAKAFLAGSQQRVDSAVDDLHASLQAKLGGGRLALTKAAGGLARHSPFLHLATSRERVRASVGKLQLLKRTRTAAAHQGLERTEAALRLVIQRGAERRRNDLITISRHWELRRAQVAGMPATLRRDAARAGAALMRVTVEALQRRSAAAARIAHVFAAVNYKSILSRGYALVLDSKNVALTSASAADAARLLTIRFGDGDVAAETKRPRAPARKKREAEQPALF